MQVNTVITSDITLYAKWEKLYKVTVTTDGNGKASASPASGTKDTSVTLKAEANNGFRFKKWEVLSGGVTISEKNTFNIGSSDVQIKAIFEVITHTVTFYMNGHGTAPTPQTIQEGKTASKPKDPAAAGYVFGGWYTDKECKKAFDFKTPVTADITLYAKWTEAATGTNGGGGTSGGQNGANGANGSIPRTDDTNHPGLWVMLIVISILAIGGVIILYRRRRMQ